VSPIQTGTTDFPPAVTADVSVHGMFERAARTHPDRVAVTTGARSVTYRILNEKAEACAARLRAAGIGPEDHVGLHVERSVEQIAWIIGVLKAGAAYVPVDMHTPLKRAESVFSAAGCVAVVSQQPVSSGALVLSPDDRNHAPPPEHAPRLNPPQVSSPDLLAYVLFTSGSTGLPKGVMVSHGNVVELFRGARAAGLDTDCDDVWSYSHSIAFDFSVWEIWGALLHGGRLVVVPHHIARSPDRFLDLVIKEKVTMLSQTPTAYRLLDAQAAKRQYPRLPLRRVVFGGEALHIPHLRHWIDAYGDETPELINMYGITETTVHVTARRVRREDLEGDGGTGPIGTPMPHTGVRVLDPTDGTAVADGAVGELVVSGSGVTRGYFGSPALTAERFVPDVNAGPGARCYRSGDLGRLKASELHYTGRHDRQLKVRGFRIEPGEIEEAVRQLPGVLDAVVLLQSRDDSPFLIAFAVVDTPAAHDCVAARQALARVLPSYEVPTVCVFIPALPMTGNGKLDEKTLLAQWERGRAERGQPTRADAEDPRSTLLSIMRRYVPVSAFAADDDFFAAGGDSITAVQVVAEAAKAGIAVSVLDLLQRPSVRALLDAPADETLGVTEPLPHPSSAFALCRDEDRRLTPDGVVDAVPATTQQQGIAYLCEISDHPWLYHDMLSVQIEGACDRYALARALAAVQDRHAALRSSLELGRFSEPLRLVWEQVPVAVEWDKAAAGSPDELSATADAWWARQTSRAVDLTRPPALRAHVTCGSDAFRLSLGTHHAFVDGWSFARLVTDLLVCYDAALRDAPLRLPPLPLGADQAHAALERAAVDKTESADFWHAQADVPALFSLPVGQQPPLARSLRFLPLSERQVQDLRCAARAAAVPLKSLTLAMHARALARIAGRRQDIVTGLVVNGRPEVADADLLVGMYLKTIPLRIAAAHANVADTARSAFAAERAAHEHRHYPLALIDARLRRPSFEVCFNFTDFHVYQAIDALSQVRTSGWRSADMANFPLLVDFMADSPDSGPGVNLRFDPSLLPADLIDRYAAELSVELGLETGGATR
jgi:amino acid adenylation domain-containing protein